MLYHDPDALMRGAGVWADAATGLQGIENWLDAHPALLSLIKNTGSVVGGALWLKNLTPVGILTGLVVNYGYEKLLQLMEGNIEVAKEHLTTYFQAHDEDITPEQASYLANIAMKVLQTAGQIAVHQVAATKFNAVRKGVQLKTRQAPKGMIESAAKKFKSPKGWVQKSANNNKGTKYANPSRPEDYIRFSEANLHPNAPSGQRVPYFQRHKNGKVLTTTGEWIRRDLADPESYHIPQTMLEKLKHNMDL